MVVENFKNGDGARLSPLSTSYISSWISDKLDRCYQLMETEDRALFGQWMANWNDLIGFEVHAVISSKEAPEKIGPRP